MTYVHFINRRKNLLKAPGGAFPLHFLEFIDVGAIVSHHNLEDGLKELFSTNMDYYNTTFTIGMKIILFPANSNSLYSSIKMSKLKVLECNATALPHIHPVDKYSAGIVFLSLILSVGTESPL